MNCLAGIAPSGESVELVLSTLVENLRFAAVEPRRAGIELLLEPVNTRDVPGFFVNRADQALAVLDMVEPGVKLQLDIYHAQVMEGDLARSIEAQPGRIGHLQVADNPGRHEPGTGEIDYPYLFARLDELGYTGWIGCEYKPAAATAAGLGWLSPHLAAGASSRSHAFRTGKIGA